jgi:hypothetical protein
MTMTLHDIAFHRSVAELIDALHSPPFWRTLARTLAQYVHHDSWVALIFSEGRPQVLAESPGDDGAPDLLFQDYLHGLYLLDPFYIASRESGREGLVHLGDAISASTWWPTKCSSTSPCPARAPCACPWAHGNASCRSRSPCSHCCSPGWRR